MPVGLDDRFVTVAALGDDVEPGRHQQPADQGADLPGVVDQDDGRCGFTGIGHGSGEFRIGGTASWAAPPALG